MEDVRELLLKILKKLDPKFIEDSLDIKYIQNFKNRYDVFGQFRNDIGVYEFAISFDTKGNIKRNHINMIRPLKFDDEIQKKLRE
jgi:hypothetical protein